tara:strand:- start:1927 stop:3498 length:1572 start_codon:yes stop_codon:yes gene_type:complete
MYNSSKLAICGALFGAAAFMISDSAALADHPAGTGGKFEVHMNRGISGFDHIKVPQGGMGRFQVLYAVHDLLFRQDSKTGKLIPRLATKATHSDDYKLWRVTLRKGVRFSNGEELTSEAYVHHFKRLLGSKLAGRYRAALGPRLDRVEAADKHTLNFIFSEPHLAFDSVMAAGIYVWYLNAPGFAKANENKPDYNRMSVGAGPYMIKEWIPGKGVTVVRNRNYWNPKEQHADEIRYIIRTGPETGAPWNALRAKDLDVGWSLNGSILPRAMKNKNLVVKNGGRGTMHWAVNFNQDYKPLDNLLVRKALAHAIDRQAILKVVTKGMAKLANQAFPKGSRWHCPGIKFPDYDVAKAKALLKQYGKPIPTFDIWTYNIPSFKKLTIMLQAMWKKIGVNVNVKVGGRGPSGVIFKIVKGETPIYMIVQGPTIHPTIYEMNMHSKAKDNNWRVRSPKLDAAIEKVQTARSDADVKKAHCAFEQAKTEEVPYQPFEHAILATVAQKGIKGVPYPDNPIIGYHHLYRDKK